MSTNTDRLAAIRRLSAEKGTVEQRKTDAEVLVKDGADTRRVIRALVQGLWDQDQSVRRTCKQTLRRHFEEIDSDGRKLIVDVLLIKLAGDPNPPRQVVSLFSTLVGWVRNNRSSHPNLFLTIVTEAERSRRGGSYSPRVRSALKDIYRNNPTDESPTGNLVSNFNQQRSVSQLLSDTAPPEEVKSSLRVLGEQPLAETDFDVLLYHLIPIRNIKDQSVMLKALRNLEAWSKELPGNDVFDLTDAVKELKAYQRADSDQLPGEVRNEIALSKVALDTLNQEAQRLRELPQYTQSLDYIIEILDGITGVQEVVDMLVEVARQDDGTQRQKAVQTLCAMLRGLDADKKAYPAAKYRDRIQHVTDDNTEAVDDKIRTLFQELGESNGIEAESVYAAVNELVRSKPPDLPDRLNSLLDGRDGSDPVVRAVLDAVSDEAILAASNPIRNAIQQFDNRNTTAVQDAIHTVEELGDDDARSQLMDLMEDSEPQVADMARDALIRSGYYQNVRAKETIDRAGEFAEESEERKKTRTRLETERVEALDSYKRLEGTLRKQLLTADTILKEGLVDIINGRLDSLDTLIDLHEENLRVEHLVDTAGSHHQSLQQHLRRLTIGADVEEGILEEFRSIEQDLAYLEELVDSDSERASSLSDHLDEVNQELSSLKALDSLDEEQETRKMLLEYDRESIREISEGYKESAQTCRKTVSDYRQRLERKRDTFENTSVNVSQPLTDIESAISYAQTRERRIESLTEQRDAEWEQILRAVENRESELTEHLASLRQIIEELESIQRSIDETTKEIGDNLLAQQHLSQQSREDQEAYHNIDRRARGHAQKRNKDAVEQSNFYKHHREYQAFVREYYEFRLNEVESGRFNNQYADSLREIQTKVEEYYE